MKNKHPRFKVFFITYGGVCSPYYVDPLNGEVTSKDRKESECFNALDAACPHCTSVANWAKLCKARFSMIAKINRKRR